MRTILTRIGLDPDALHEMAVRANGTCTAQNLHLGRCLAAIDESEIHQSFGCSGAIHYAINCLGMQARRARELRRIAGRLDPLPLLTRAAENGEIDYSKLREIVRRATPETETHWLALCQRMTYSKIERLVVNTPKGARPREEDARPTQPKLHQLRLSCGPEEMALFESALRLRSQEEGRVVTFMEAMVEFFGQYVSSARWGKVDVERALREAALDVAAQDERAAQNERAVQKDAEDLECPARDEDWPLSVATAN